MEKMTITQALAERKIIRSRIEREYSEMSRYMVREDNRIDPLEKIGGSEKYIKERQQAIDALIERYVRMMKAIHVFNTSTMVEFAGRTRTVDEWLTYHKDLVSTQIGSCLLIQKVVDSALKTNDKVMVVAGKRGETEKPVQVVINTNPVAFNENISNLMEMKDRLWSMLSMLNAKTEIEF